MSETAAAPAAARRIVQMLDGESARSILYICGIYHMPPAVVLDSQGLLWTFGPKTPGESEIGWFAVPLPLLPEGSAADV